MAGLAELRLGASTFATCEFGGELLYLTRHHEDHIQGCRAGWLQSALAATIWLLFSLLSPFLFDW